MAAPTDFLQLYNELGIAPGATLDELKNAYRRRVSELHPDRRESIEVDDDSERLQELTVLYGAATDFHRRYGRLPGEVATPRPPTRMPPPRWSSETAASESRKQSSSKGPWIVSAGVIVLAWLAFAPPWQEPVLPPPPDPSTYGNYAPPARRAVDATMTLRIGMSAAEVRSLQGDPMVPGDDRWEYGPSWIAFEKHKVSDWYSSPLRPLKWAAPHPPVIDTTPQRSARTPHKAD